MMCRSAVQPIPRARCGSRRFRRSPRLSPSCSLIWHKVLETQLQPTSARDNVKLIASAQYGRCPGNRSSVGHYQPGGTIRRKGFSSNAPRDHPVPVLVIPADERHPVIDNNECMSTAHLRGPASDRGSSDPHNREVCVVVRPRFIPRHVQRVAIGDRTELTVIRVTPREAQVRPKADQPRGADGCGSARLSPSEVAEHAFVEIAHPNVAGERRLHISNSVSKHTLPQKFPVGIVDGGVGLGRPVTPTAPRTHQEHAPVRQWLDMAVRK